MKTSGNLVLKYLMLLFTAISVHIFIFNKPLSAQSVAEEFKKLADSDTSDMRLLAAYPKDVRDNLLKVSAHPEVIVQLGDLQKTSRTSFRDLIKGFSKEDQSKIWNLTRYDGLTEKLIAAKGRSKKIESALKNYPSEIHADAKWMATEHRELLMRIDEVSKDFNNSFQRLTSNFDPEIKPSITALLKTPEVINLLNDNMRMTVYLGDFYKRDPKTAQEQFDSLSLLAAQENLRDRQAIQQAVAEDPEAAEELKKSAATFADENGYAESEYSSGKQEVITQYVYLPYPYWYGYPWWYEYAYWYPYPYWYHWGYYLWEGQIVWISPPSWYYLNWHFYHHHHMYDYPHISNIYINHYYYGPRRSHGRNTVVVNQWMRRNETVLPRDFGEAKELRIARIREIGKAGMDYDEYKSTTPEKPISREEFINQRSDNYPSLKNPVKEETISPQVPAKTPPEKRPMELPQKRDDQPAKIPAVKTPPPIIRKPADQKQEIKPVPDRRDQPISQPPARQEPVKAPEKQAPPKKRQ